MLTQVLEDVCRRGGGTRACTRQSPARRARLPVRFETTPGAVLPGAVVEASSPALIEGRRSAVTDGQGQYSIVDLRPGLYTVTFALEGFSRVVREGVQLPSNFTATVDVTLNLSTLQETVTVSGASPVVDVTQTQRTTVFTRELMNAIPTSNNMWSLRAARSGRDDERHRRRRVEQRQRPRAVGARSEQHPHHHVGRRDEREHDAGGWPGGAVFSGSGERGGRARHGGGSADMSSGGLRINMIPRDGGNRRSGTVFLGGTPGSWQADNFTQRLKDAGMRSVDKIERIFDYGGTTGGPIIQNRLWYNVSARYWGTYDLPADSFLDDGSAARRDGDRWGVIPRFTFQATPRDKLSLHVERIAQFRGPRLPGDLPGDRQRARPGSGNGGRWRDPALADYLVIGEMDLDRDEPSAPRSQRRPELHQFLVPEHAGRDGAGRHPGVVRPHREERRRSRHLLGCRADHPAG